MLEEARGAESDADFISKCCISLNECRESWTRLRVCKRCQIGPRRKRANWWAKATSSFDCDDDYQEQEKERCGEETQGGGGQGRS
jgi:hypothetical protein